MTSKYQPRHMKGAMPAVAPVAPAVDDQPTGQLAPVEQVASLEQPESLEQIEPDEQPEQTEQPAAETSVARSAAMMGGLVIVSRITGFLRTWGQAFALGLTLTSSCYTVASNLPNQLYELVIGGLLATSFLPVYLNAKEKVSREGASEYASNLLSIILLLMGLFSAAGIAFAGQFIWTQSFTASSTFDSELAVYFFRFFAIEIVLYGLSAVVSGILNAERDYFWSNAAPILNNVICTSSFFIYAALSPSQPGLAMLILAIGNPLGVAAQLVVQYPALRRHNVRLRLRINWHDPLLRDTLAIGAPTLVCTVMSFATVSVQTTAALSVTDQGSSIAYYARLWYTLPYSIIAVPITTAMFTELSSMASRGDHDGFVEGLASGVGKILFYLVPFAVYLICFSDYLITLMAFGKFSPADIGETATFLSALAVSLPFYGVCTYLQKACSSLRRMGLFAMACVVAGILQIVVCLVGAPLFGLSMVAYSSTAFYVAVDFVTLVSLRKQLGGVGLRSMMVTTIKGVVLGVIGGIVGMLVSYLVYRLVGGSLSPVLTALVCVMGGGIPALLVTFGIAVGLHMPEASFVGVIVGKLLPGSKA